MIEVPSILLKIRDRKLLEVEYLYSSGNYERYKSQAAVSQRGFTQAISKPGFNLIAEFKKASPSKGEIRPGANPCEIAQLYEASGAAAISVLTDAAFQGELEYLRRIEKVTTIPLIRKDFIIDSAQIYEARVYGADAILLIAALLPAEIIREYINIAGSLGMVCLVESHNESELERAIEGGAKIFGINNRNLNDFTEDRTTTLRLLPNIPKGYPIVTESAITTQSHVQELTHPRINAMLVGEAIMSLSQNPGVEDMRKKIHELIGKQ